jgi:GTPase
VKELGVNVPGSEADNQGKRCGFIAVVGSPNAGKSTLVNAFVGAKVSIVSHKVQTTRVPVRGIAIENQSQLVFIDTPGIFQPKRRLDRAMVDAAWGRALDADVIIVLIDAAKGIDEDTDGILRKLKDVRALKVVALNKVDWIEEKERLLALTAEVSKRATFDKLFMISALDGTGITDMPIRQLAAEITRERIYHWLHEELPYAITVETTSWKTLKGGAVRIEQTIFVERDGQKSIVLGKGGATIKQISMEARKQIADVADVPVHLFLFVKVRSNWGSDPERYREMGLDFPKD